jgi:integrase
MLTGVRRGEALGLTWERIDWARGVVLLTETKNGRAREVQLSANADAALARRWTPGATGLVFGSRNWNSFRQAWVAAVKAAGIAKFRFHDLRHTTASWLVQQGRSLREVKELLGHSDIHITMRYAHLAPDHLRAAVASLDGILSPAPAAGGATLEAVELRRKDSTRTSSTTSAVR